MEQHRLQFIQASMIPGYFANNLPFIKQKVYLFKIGFPMCALFFEYFVSIPKAEGRVFSMSLGLKPLLQRLV